jgi:uncharacterized repeat protein (TIGR03803 family)
MLSAQTATPLVDLDGTDGAFPVAPLVQATNGNFYGTTEGGGASSEYCGANIGTGCGTVFAISPTGKLTTLHSFCLESGCTDGLNPTGGLVQMPSGDFFGTTSQGGANSCPGEVTCGTIFKITPSGVLTTVYNFCSQSGCADGEMPRSSLILGPGGDLYGTTLMGGPANAGTVFKITPAGVLTTLYSFCAETSCSDGTSPWGALVVGADGDLYGTTAGGGQYASPACKANGGCGTIFKITPNGALSTVYTFCSANNECTDGLLPYAGLVLGRDGNLYGTTYNGGANPGDSHDTYGPGTVFKLSSGGTLTTLYSFCPQSACTDGSSPKAALALGVDGNLYGATFAGGANCGPGGCGALFEITPEGDFHESL